MVLLSIACLLLIGLLILWQPGWFIAILANYSPEVIYSVKTGELVVALTIDDGPDAVTTPKMLNLLKEYNAHATFFLLAGRVAGNETLVRRIVREEHEIGNHMVFDHFSIGLSPAEFERQLVESNRILSNFADIHWFRPGSGWFNAKMLSIIQKHRHRTALGSIFPYDTHLPWSWFSTRYILWKVHPGSIIILHDSHDRGERTTSTLATILPELNRRGFRIVTLSELLASQSVSETEGRQENC
jgi:peptidoglycan/xylan/chitin deacetylase (PgdA/CDA1 family)